MMDSGSYLLGGQEAWITITLTVAWLISGRGCSLYAFRPFSGNHLCTKPCKTPSVVSKSHSKP